MKVASSMLHEKAERFISRFFKSLFFKITIRSKLHLWLSWRIEINEEKRAFPKDLKRIQLMEAETQRRSEN